VGLRAGSGVAVRPVSAGGARPVNGRAPPRAPPDCSGLRQLETERFAVAHASRQLDRGQPVRHIVARAARTLLGQSGSAPTEERISPTGSPRPCRAPSSRPGGARACRGAGRGAVAVVTSRGVCPRPRAYCGIRISRRTHRVCSGEYSSEREMSSASCGTPFGLSWYSQSSGCPAAEYVPNKPENRRRPFGVSPIGQLPHPLIRCLRFFRGGWLTAGRSFIGHPSSQDLCRRNYGPVRGSPVRGVAHASIGDGSGLATLRGGTTHDHGPRR
jgi:hypothetical protein